MPAKKNKITDAERAKRIRELAREAETSNRPEGLRTGIHERRDTAAKAKA